jgi:hypothetical protein
LVQKDFTFTPDESLLLSFFGFLQLIADASAISIFLKDKSPDALPNIPSSFSPI